MEAHLYLAFGDIDSGEHIDEITELVALIASGYRAFGYIVLVIDVISVLTIGLWRVARGWTSGQVG